jgi:membrane protein DedA with SNARE-associated domain
MMASENDPKPYQGQTLVSVLVGFMLGEVVAVARGHQSIMQLVITSAFAIIILCLFYIKTRQAVHQPSKRDL